MRGSDYLQKYERRLADALENAKQGAHNDQSSDILAGGRTSEDRSPGRNAEGTNQTAAFQKITGCNSLEGEIFGDRQSLN